MKIINLIIRKIYDIKMYNKVKKLMDNENELIEYLKSLESKLILNDGNIENMILSIGEIFQISVIIYSINPKMLDKEEINNIINTIKPYMNISKFQ